MRTFAGAGAVALLLSVVPPARADDFVVTTQQDGTPGSLRDAITQANAKGGAHTITFQTDGTILGLKSASFGDYGPTVFTITADITIDGGPDRGYLLHLDGTVDRARIFTVPEGGKLTLRRVQISGGNSVGFTGGGSQTGGQGGGSAGLGGAIFNRGMLVVDACTFLDNYATGGNGGTGSGLGLGGGGGGAGLALDGGLASPTDGGFGGLPNGGTAGTGFGGAGGDGGIGGGGGGSAVAGPVSTPAAPGNGGFGGGGGGSGADVGASGTLAGGAGGFGGGGGGSGYGAAGIGAGGAGGFGGGAGGKAGIQNLIPNGGGGGGGAGMGGAIFNDGGTVRLTNCTFARNGATGGRGGAGVLAATDGADGLGLGGGVFCRGGMFEAISCTFTECTAEEGGAVYLRSEVGRQLDLNLGNSILANTPDGATDAVLSSDGMVITSIAVVPCLIEKQTGLSGIMPVTADPQLGELRSNGGPVQTCLPSPDGPAIDAGQNLFALETDARGAPRTSNLVGTADAFDGTDFGAVEYGVNLRVTTEADAPGGVVWPGAPLTYTVRVENDGPDVAPGVQVYETVPAGLENVVVETSVGEVTGTAPQFTVLAGDLGQQGVAIVTVRGTVSAASGQLTNHVGSETGSDETDFADNESDSTVEVQGGLGTLYLTSTRFTIDWRKHAVDVDRDMLRIAGVLNQAEYPDAFDGATVEVLVNGTPLPVVATLDARGRARSARKESPGHSVSVRPNGKFTASFSGLDLRDFVGFREVEDPETVRLRVEVMLTPATGAPSHSAGTFEFSQRESRTRRSTGSFSHRKNRTVSGVLVPFRTSVVQSAAGDTLGFSCAFAPFEGGPILIGEAQDGWEVYLEFPGDEAGGEAAAFPRTGADDAKSRFRLGPGDSYGLKRFVLDNRARTLQFTTTPLTAIGSGVPPVGDDALTHRLSFSAIVLSPTTRAQSEAAARIRRKKTTSGRWTQ